MGFAKILCLTVKKEYAVENKIKMCYNINNEGSVGRMAVIDSYMID